MLKFLIISRSQPGQTRERFFYEWAFIHVSLMLHTAPSMRRFKRYVQHFVNPDFGDDCRVLPRSPMLWESLAEHWIEKFDPTVPGPEYREQMLPHKFSDSNFEVPYILGQTDWQRADFRSGGVKVIHKLMRRADIDDGQFAAAWRGRHVPLLVDRLQQRGLRKVVTNLPYRFDPAEFHAVRKGTLLERANIDMAAGYEELWFDRLDDALALGRDPALRAMLADSYAGFADTAASTSLITNERVVFDTVTPGELSPPPAVFDVATLDATVFTTGRPYHEPRLPAKD